MRKLSTVILFMMFIISISSACSDRVSESIEEGRLFLMGNGEHWEAEVDIKTKVSVSEYENSTIVVPLNSIGEIRIKCKGQYDTDVHLEYLLSKFEAEGTETLLANTSEVVVGFEGGIPYDDENRTYTLTLKWNSGGEVMEEVIELVQ